MRRLELTANPKPIYLQARNPLARPLRHHTRHSRNPRRTDILLFEHHLERAGVQRQLAVTGAPALLAISKERIKRPTTSLSPLRMSCAGEKRNQSRLAPGEAGLRDVETENVGSAPHRVRRVDQLASRGRDSAFFPLFLFWAAGSGEREGWFEMREEVVIAVRSCGEWFGGERQGFRC